MFSKLGGYDYYRIRKEYFDTLYIGKRTLWEKLQYITILVIFRFIFRLAGEELVDRFV
jgi:hypothetical protein